MANTGYTGGRGYGNEKGNSKRASSPMVLKGKPFSGADVKAEMANQSGNRKKATSPTVIKATPARAPVKSQATNGSVAGPTKAGGFSGYEHKGGWSGK